jgi:hypothetical protein
MKARTVGAACVLTVLLGSACAEAPGAASFTGSFLGASRPCKGGLHVRSKTLDWITTYQVCKARPYEVLEEDFSGVRRRIVFQIRKRGRACGMEVFELQQANPRAGKWDAAAFPSLEAYRKRAEPGWIDSTAPERQSLLCILYEPDR